MSVLYTRMPRLFADLAIAHGDARYARLLRSLARVKLLILDDWGPETLTSNQARDLLEIVEDRYDRGSLIITSQVPIDRWHDLIGVPTLVDPTLDRVVHNATESSLPARACASHVPIPENDAPERRLARPSARQGRGQRRAPLRRCGGRATPAVTHRHPIRPSQPGHTFSASASPKSTSA